MILSLTGQLFPDTDPKWKGARSDIYLGEAVSYSYPGHWQSRAKIPENGPWSCVSCKPTPTLLQCVYIICMLQSQVRLMEERGYVLGNIDCTIIAQKPKLSPHKVNTN